MDDNKETLEELFRSGNRILTELEKSTAEKSQQLEDANRRYKDFREELQELLNRRED